jgi:hypothetical protein
MTYKPEHNLNGHIQTIMNPPNPTRCNSNTHKPKQKLNDPMQIVEKLPSVFNSSNVGTKDQNWNSNEL